MYKRARRKGTVRFAIRVDRTRRAVAVAGDFSDWQPVAMKRQRDGTFVGHVPVGLDSFEYKFLVDGHWINDPDHSRWAPNDFGTFNSVGQLERDPAASGAVASGASPAAGSKGARRG